MGLGYVGIATAVAFANGGKYVVGYDIDSDRLRQLADGRTPIYEPGLAALVSRYVKNGHFGFVESLDELISSCRSIFLSVPTPSSPDGTIDLSFIKQAAKDVGFALAKAKGWRLIVVKSTVIPGTAEEVVAPLIASLSGKTLGKDFSVASNPEFLAEGTMVEDALHPTRVVIGVTDRESDKLLRSLYSGSKTRVVTLTPTAAELVKYSSNAMLATRVSFANEISRLAEKAGVDVYPVLEAVGMDPRIGSRFLKAGPGFGGSCFTKDLKALASWAEKRGVKTPLASATLEVNDAQARHVVELAWQAAGGLKGRTVALLGLAFKADTDDARDSRAYPMAEELVKEGATVVLFDPVASENFRRGLPRTISQELGHHLFFATSLKEALKNADYALIQCDWEMFRKAPVATWKALKGALVVDARRTLNPTSLARIGVRYVSVGLGTR
jgi:UDPglucose 6-dehydrogenase